MPIFKEVSRRLRTPLRNRLSKKVYKKVYRKGLLIEVEHIVGEDTAESVSEALYNEFIKIC